MLPLRARVYLGAMAINGYSAFPKTPALLEPHHQIVQCHIQDTRYGGGLTPLQRYSQCILQPQLTGQKKKKICIHQKACIGIILHSNQIFNILWKYLTVKMKNSFFQAAVVSILLYGCTLWTLTKRLEKKLDGNYTRMLQAILNKF